MMKRKTLPFVLALAFLSLTSLFAQTSNYEVTNAVVTTTIADRMPEVQTANNTFASSVERLFYFTKIEQASAPTSIRHEWYWQGEQPLNSRGEPVVRCLYLRHPIYHPGGHDSIRHLVIRSLGR